MPLLCVTLGYCRVTVKFKPYNPEGKPPPAVRADRMPVPRCHGLLCPPHRILHPNGSTVIDIDPAEKRIAKIFVNSRIWRFFEHQIHAGDGRHYLAKFHVKYFHGFDIVLILFIWPELCNGRPVNPDAYIFSLEDSI